MLNSRYPMFIAWGPELGFLYNDAYVPIFGAKHPHTLGLPFADVWGEIWDDVAPLVDRALAGEATFNENLHLVMQRNGFPEDTWYTFSYSPVRDETGGIGGMFCAVQETTAQVQAEQRWLEQTRRQRSQFEQAPGFICILSGPDHIFEFVNQAYVRLLGERDFIGRPVRDAVPEARGQGFLEMLDQVYSSGERIVANAAPITLRMSPDEPEIERYLDFIYAPIIGEDGAVTGIFVEGQDVTVRQIAAEAETRSNAQLRLLTDELNHRVKNTLSIVQSLAQQSFKGSAATDAARRAFEGRLITLAQTHNLLTSRRWESADLRDVVLSALHGHAVDRTRLKIDGPPVPLAPQVAVALALAMHELATNATKYGSLSLDGGRVEVVWRVHCEHKPRLSLRWQERDGPLIAGPVEKGFGSRMIERALASEGGEVRLDLLPDGAVCRIDVDLPVLVET